tara:strand:+ start:37 stop:543 length:507 start_codon:yes stop_codon:yes gene_type:complete
MLGSINTGGFFNQKGGKSLVDAMKDSNYFERKGVEGVYEPRNKKAPIVTGSFKGDSKGFLDKFKEGALSNLEKSKEKSDTDKYLDFLKETRGMAQGGQFGSGMGGFSQEVAEGLTTFVPPSTQQMFIPGQEGKPGLFSVGGAIRGGIGGFMKGGPAGALGGAAMGGFM